MYKIRDRPIPSTIAILRIQECPTESPFNDHTQSTKMSDDEEEINDCFTTHWMGPFDRRALEYAAKHRLCYSTGPERTIQLGNAFLIRGGNGGSNRNKLLATNCTSDAEVRAFHVSDPEISIGASIIYDTPGKSRYQATRVEKLRSCALRRKHLLEDIEEEEAEKE